MIEERAIKTHLIVTDIHEEYLVKWRGRIIDTNPLLKNGVPVFILISPSSRVEMNTIDIKWIEETAKSITNPRGRAAITTDEARIYIKEVNGNEAYVGSVIHRRVKSYAPMYDKVGYRQ